MLSLRTPIPFLAIVAFLAVPAAATTSYYQGASGETAFNSGIGGLTLLDPLLTFSASDLASGGLYNASGTGIDFLGFDNLNNPLNFTVSSGRLTATAGGEQATINFPAAGVYALGIHITVTSSSSFGNWCLEFTRNACSGNVVTLNSSSIGFLGFISDTPVTAPLYIRPVSGTPTMVFTDFEAYSVPEPQTWLLVGLGLLILLLTRRKVQRRAQ